MFTGILQGIAEVVDVASMTGLERLTVRFPPGKVESVQIGASISIDGVCLTVVQHQQNECVFDVVQETIDCSTLGLIKKGAAVNFERALRYGDEVGGHSVSGHVDFFTTVSNVEIADNNLLVFFDIPEKWRRFIFEKGYVAVHGASLTVASVNDQAQFSISLIPETRRVTTLGKLQTGSLVNIEIDRLTQAVVETVDRRLQEIGVLKVRT